MTSLERPIRNILESDHQELDVLLAEAESALAVADPEAVFRSLDLFWARLAMHIRAEHVRLFPALREARVDEDRRVRLLELMAELRHDHDFFMVELARAIKAARLMFYFGNETETFANVREILDRVKQRLASHNITEENDVYPLADEPFLSAKQLEETAAGIVEELNKYPARYKNRDTE